MTKPRRNKLRYSGFTHLLGATRFYGYSKLTCWKAFMSSNLSVRNVFQFLGGSLTDDVYNEMEQYVYNFKMKN